MADPVPNMEMNTGTQGSPTWTSVMGANQEWRFSDARQTNIASASWPQMIRPAATGGVDYLHAYTADATGDWVAGAIFALATYHQCRWTYAAGTFASAPILTAYASTAHAAITRGDGSFLGGHATDTGGTARSYLKATAYGFFGQTPAAAPTGSFPTVTDGSTGSVATLTGAWTNAGGAWQGLQGDNDYITCGSTPGGAGSWEFVLRLFAGPNFTPGTWTPVTSAKYTWV
jgi:hypothetical protein